MQRTRAKEAQSGSLGGLAKAPPAPVKRDGPGASLPERRRGGGVSPTAAPRVGVTGKKLLPRIFFHEVKSKQPGESKNKPRGKSKKEKVRHALHAVLRPHPANPARQRGWERPGLAPGQELLAELLPPRRGEIKCCWRGARALSLSAPRLLPPPTPGPEPAAGPARPGAGHHGGGAAQPAGESAGRPAQAVPPGPGRVLAAGPEGGRAGAAGRAGGVDAGHGAGGGGWGQRGPAAGRERPLHGAGGGACPQRAAVPQRRKVCHGNGLGTLLQSGAYCSSCEDDRSF